MKEFNSIQDIITDEVFIKNVDKFINDVKEHLRNRPSGEFKRQWFDRLIDIDGLNSSFFINNFLAISIKRSTLSAELRKIIHEACDMAIHQTLIYYSNQSKVQDEKQDVK